MPFNIRLAMGLGGVSPHDNHRAYLWEKRLHWPMLVVFLLAIPATATLSRPPILPGYSPAWSLC